MEKKLFGVLLMLSVICFAFALPSVSACHKSATLLSTGDGDNIMETGEVIVWHIQIYIANVGDELPLSDWTNVVVKDNFGAELELASVLTPSLGTSAISWTQGGSNQLRILWTVGNLPVNAHATLDFDIRTDHNPAGKQEYTSPGEYALNSGANMKCIVNGHQGSLTMDPIMVTILPQD